MRNWIVVFRREIVTEKGSITSTIQLPLLVKYGRSVIGAAELYAEILLPGWEYETIVCI